MVSQASFHFQAAVWRPSTAIFWLKRVTVVSINFLAAIRQAQRLPSVSSKHDTVYALPSPGSKAFTVVVFRALRNSNFSTMDYDMSLQHDLLRKQAVYQKQTQLILVQNGAFPKLES